MEDSVNPCPPEWLDRDVNVMLRGDAIGDTAYTHRWVLKCLFTITQALPKYLAGFDDNPQLTCLAEDKDNLPKLKQNGEMGHDDEIINLQQKVKTDIMELDEEVEDAACQLWDMTVEKSVTQHLLDLEEVDIFELVSLIVEHSHAPRLTEVMVGVLANMCCQEKCCEKLLEKKEHNNFLLCLLDLLGECSDVPTICEVLRLMRLLLWHRINRTPKSSWAGCSLIKLLCQEQGQSVIAFLLNNSLSNLLLANLLELLGSFLFICLPETGLNVASLFSNLVSGLIELLKKKSSHIVINVEDEKEKIIVFTIRCLCSFIDTPGSRLIIEEVQKSDSQFESLLIQYLELEGRVDCLEELVGDIPERLCHVISLCQLIIPYMKIPSTLLTIGRVLSLVHGQIDQYSVSRSTSKEDIRPPSRNEGVEHINFVYKVADTSRRKSAEGRLVTSKESLQNKAAAASKVRRQFSNPPFEECCWVSPPATPIVIPTKGKVKSVEKNILVTTDDINIHKEPSELLIFTPTKLPPENDTSNSSKVSFEETNIADFISLDLSELNEALEDYCYQLLAWWWSSGPDKKSSTEAQKNILDILDQCHAHEVHFILKAVRSRDPTLVPRLQEQILDSGVHQRLVALLAHMYQ